MPGTLEGGRKAAITNKAKYGKDWYAQIGKIGGANGTTGGFATKTPCDCTIIEAAHHKAQCSGFKGGLVSRRNKSKIVK